MIYDATHWSLPVVLDAEVCVVGSGAGGAMAAMTLAEGGRRVVLLEAGAFLTPEHMSQREEEMIPQLLWENGGRSNTSKTIKIIQGKGLGGSTLHNLNLCRRIPTEILAEWQHERSLEHLTLERWDELYTFVEQTLSVTEVPRELWNRHNLLLERGCQALGWRGGGMRHNRTGCIGSGFCELGCAYDGKNNAAKVLIPRFVAAGGDAITHVTVTELLHKDGAMVGVRGVVLDPATGDRLTTVEVHARTVVVSASATATAALLLRSDVPDPSGETGNNLRIHPALVVAGDFDEPVEAHLGIPQTYECTEHLRFDLAHPPGGLAVDTPANRTWIVTAFAHPMGTATVLPGLGPKHTALLGRWRHMGVLTAVLHERGAGSVRPTGGGGLAIDYELEGLDRQELATALVHCARLLFAAGARRVIVPSNPPLELAPSDALEQLADPSVALDRMTLTAVHPMGTVRMGDRPEQSAVDSRGRHHHLRGLWVADGSLFPTSIGGPPQLSIYALGRHVGEHVLRELAGG